MGRPFDGAATIIHLSMRIAYKFSRLRNKIIKSPTDGAAVAIWHNGQILVVRHSYMPGWSLPGGGAKRNEEARETASREVSEEVGIDLALEELVLVRKSRSGHSLFEYQLPSPSKPQIDNREIIEAKFLNPTLVSDPDGLLSSYLKRVTGNAEGQPGKVELIPHS